MKLAALIESRRAKKSPSKARSFSSIFPPVVMAQAGWGLTARCVFITLGKVALPCDVRTVARLLRSPIKDVRKATAALARLGIIEAYGDTVTGAITLAELKRRKVRSTSILREHRRSLATQMLHEGRTRAEIARELGLSASAITSYLKTEAKPDPVESPISAPVALATPITLITSNGKALI